MSSLEADAIRDVLIPQHSTLGIPHIGIVDADSRGAANCCSSTATRASGLDEEYAHGTLTQIVLLWGRPCTVRTTKCRDAD